MVDTTRTAAALHKKTRQHTELLRYLLQVRGVGAVEPADDQDEVEPRLRDQLGYRVLPLLGGVADRVEFRVVLLERRRTELLQHRHLQQPSREGSRGERREQ